MRKRIVRFHSWLVTLGDRGQATTEYALVLLGAAVVALLVASWATSGGGGGKIGRLFDRILDEITSRVG
jgi:hypothetical protein